MVARKLFFGVIVLSAMLVLLDVSSSSYSTWYQYLVSNIDSSTDGRIVTITKESAGGRHAVNSYRYRFHYLYYVDGVPRSGDVFSYEGLATPGDAKKYSAGQPVTVYYDSGDPQFSVVEMREPGFRMYGALSPIVIFLLYVFAVVVMRME